LLQSKYNYKIKRLFILSLNITKKHSKNYEASLFKSWTSAKWITFNASRECIRKWSRSLYYNSRVLATDPLSNGSWDHKSRRSSGCHHRSIHPTWGNTRRCCIASFARICCNNRPRKKQSKSTPHCPSHSPRKLLCMWAADTVGFLVLISTQKWTRSFCSNSREFAIRLPSIGTWDHKSRVGSSCCCCSNPPIWGSTQTHCNASLAGIDYNNHLPKKQFGWTPHHLSHFPL